MIAVTGATGHIGNVLVRELVARGERVRALVPAFEDPRPLNGLDVEIVSGNLLDLDSLKHAFSGASVVYHLAGLISILPWRTKALDAVNVVGTRNVISACLHCGVKRMVYVSSVHALVEPPHGTAITEDPGCDPARTVGGYAQSKAQATVDVLHAAERDLDAVVVYPSGVVGPYDFNRSEMGQVVIDFARRKMPAYIDGAYDFVDVRDVVAGMIAACEGGRRGEGYILSGEMLSVARLMSLLAELTGIPAPSLCLPRWVAMAAAVFSPLYYAVSGGKPRFTTYSVRVLGSNCLIDSGKARRELGYAPRPIAESFADALDWFRANEML